MATKSLGALLTAAKHGHSIRLDGRYSLCALLTAATLLAVSGCSSSLPFVGRAKHESLQKAVEADAFPSAKQAGL
jgi:hypothetical protein